MSAKFTESHVRRVAVSFLGVLVITLASGSAFPLSSWFRDMACIVVLVCYLFISSSLPGICLLICLCMPADAPALRLALLAWVFMSEFWVERCPGGERRGRGCQGLVLGVVALICGTWLGVSGRWPGPWIAEPAIRALALLASLSLPTVVAVELAAVGVAAVMVALLAEGVRDAARVATCLSICSALLAAVIVLASTVGWPSDVRARDALPAGRADVALYSEGILDWSVPSPGRYGIIKSGMFGLFRKSLERFARSRGGAVVEMDSLTAGALSGAGLTVIINPVRRLAPAEQDHLARFVAGGGGLLVLGDHTDIGGSRGPLNSALRFTSMRFNFDSAVSLTRRWRGAMEMRAHPVTRGLRDEMDAQLGTGASLDIARPAFEIVTGRYAFSDRGDYDNAGRGAFMGNCSHDGGEALGGIVLVAGEEVGSGRVLVFGDTSPFQNGAHFLSQHLISNSIHWLCGEDRAGGDAGVPAIRPFESVAAVGFGRCPRAGRRLFTDSSLGGLANCLYRGGVTPVPAYDQPVAEAAFTFLIAPTRDLGAGTTHRLLDYMRSGGRLIVAKGYTTPEPCALLFAGLGFEILPVPLGSGDTAGRVRLKNAWALEYGGAPDTVMRAAAFGYPTAVTKPVGKGSFTLISDGEFFLDANLEGETDASPENVEFLAALFHDLGKDRLGLVSTDGTLAGHHTD